MLPLSIGSGRPRRLADSTARFSPPAEQLIRVDGVGAQARGLKQGVIGSPPSFAPSSYLAHPLGMWAMTANDKGGRPGPSARGGADGGGVGDQASQHQHVFQRLATELVLHEIPFLSSDR